VKLAVTVGRMDAAVEPTRKYLRRVTESFTRYAANYERNGFMLETVLGLYNYWVVIFLMMTGLYIVISRHNLVRKIVGLNVFQASVFILFITMGKVEGGTAPILAEGITRFSNPLPHVLILTAIVVGVATTAVGLSLVVRIYSAYGAIDEDDLDREDGGKP
jgi:multicomponent Na+:H+ antiporter subunit C